MASPVMDRDDPPLSSLGLLSPGYCHNGVSTRTSASLRQSARPIWGKLRYIEGGVGDTDGSVVADV